MEASRRDCDPWLPAAPDSAELADLGRAPRGRRRRVPRGHDRRKDAGMKRHLLRLTMAVTLGVLAASAAGCGKSTTSTATPTAGAGATNGPASAALGDSRSAAAQMIC